jgi:predicted N-formylglutamate amidohydrolase
VLLVCEHASNRVVAPYGTLGLSVDAWQAHIAWDPGALGLARVLMRKLDATLVCATVSRLIYDLNRPPNAPGAMPARSEIYDIPGNATIGPDERAARTRDIYLPFHDGLHNLVARRLARGRVPVLVTVHSFTPVYFGKRRDVELGVIHDADLSLAVRIAALAGTETQLATGLNLPYSAADGVTHTLRLHATPYGLANAMLEIRNDLIATAEQQETVGEALAPVLSRAVAETLAQREAAA